MRETAFPLIERQRRTKGPLLGFALNQQRYGEAYALIQSLEQLWHVHGLEREAQGLTERYCKAFEADDGRPRALSARPARSGLDSPTPHPAAV